MSTPDDTVSSIISKIFLAVLTGSAIITLLWLLIKGHYPAPVWYAIAIPIAAMAWLYPGYRRERDAAGRAGASGRR